MESSYLLESIDLDGRRTFHGPIDPRAGASAPEVIASPVLGTQPAAAALARLQATSGGAPASPVVADVNPRDLPAQWDVADGPALKIFIDSPGWYRLSQPALVAAGLNRAADPRTFRLLVEDGNCRSA
jgi:hypothetical protein